MNSQFSQILANNINIILVVFALIFVVFIIWLFFIHLSLRRFTRAYKEMFRGVTKKDLEEVLIYHTKKLEKSSKDIEQIKKQLKKIEAGLKISIKKIGIVRFNPFGDTGGNQSFSIALLDSEGSGFVLSSLYGRSENRIFAKPVEARKSSYKLSEEEEKAIKKAL